MKRIFVYLLIVNFLTGTAGATPYVVQDGDTLSQIVGRRIPGPVWGQSGSFKTVLALNPSISSPDNIYPGQTIELGDAPATAAAAQIDLPRRTLASETVPEVSAPVETTVSVSPPRAEEHAEPVTPPAIVPSTSNADDLDHGISLDFGYRFSSLNATDLSSQSTGTLRSAYSIDESAVWRTHWSESFSSFARFSMQEIKFEPSTNSTYSLDNISQTLFHIAIGGEHSLSSRFKFNYGVGFGQVLAIHNSNSNTVSVDAVPLPDLSAGLAWKMLERKRTSLGISIAGVVYGPGSSDSYTVQTGGGFSGALFLERGAGTSAYRLDLGYEERTQSTSIVRLQQNDLFFRFSSTFPWLLKKEGTGE